MKKIKPEKKALKNLIKILIIFKPIPMSSLTRNSIWTRIGQSFHWDWIKLRFVSSFIKIIIISHFAVTLHFKSRVGVQLISAWIHLSFNKSLCMTNMTLQFSAEQPARITSLIFGCNKWNNQLCISDVKADKRFRFHSN